MNKLQKIGGIAALVEAGTFIVGFVLYFTVLSAADYGSLDIDPLQNVAFLAEHQAMMYAWNLIIYVLFGICLVVLAIALYERLKTPAKRQLEVQSPSIPDDGSYAIAKTATAFGFIWAGLVIASGMVANIGASLVVEIYGRDPTQAASLWLTMHFIVDGLGGGNEIIGGLWVLLISWAALSHNKLSKALSYFGITVGAVGVITFIPSLTELGAAFGLGSIVWFLWVGKFLILEDVSKHS